MGEVKNILLLLKKMVCPDGFVFVDPTYRSCPKTVTGCLLASSQVSLMLACFELRYVKNIFESSVFEKEKCVVDVLTIMDGFKFRRTLFEPGLFIAKECVSAGRG